MSLDQTCEHYFEGGMHDESLRNLYLTSTSEGFHLTTRDCKLYNKPDDYVPLLIPIVRKYYIEKYSKTEERSVRKQDK